MKKNYNSTILWLLEVIDGAHDDSYINLKK